MTAALVAGTSSTASAQAWLSDRDRAQGHGILVGGLELHPGIGAELGYDNNVYLADTNEQDSAILRVAPHLFLSTLGKERSEGANPPALRFRSGLSGSLLHYFSTAQDTDVEVGQDLQLTINPERPFTLDLFEELSRKVQPFTEAVAPGTRGSIDFARTQIDAGTRIQLSTPGGLLKGSLGYRIHFDHFEGEEFSGERSRSHVFSGKTSWEFLPKTAVFWEGDVTLHEFANPNITTLGIRNDSTLLATRVGLNGGLTSKLGFTIAAGYGAGFFDDDNDYDGVIAQVEARWRPQPSILWMVGYDRGFAPAFQGNWVRFDRPKTRFDLMLGGAFLLSAKGKLSFVTYGDDVFNMTTPISRDDVHLDLDLSGEYRFIEWLAVTAEVGYLANITDFEYPAFTDPVTGATTPPDPGKYNRVEAWLGVRAFF